MHQYPSDKFIEKWKDLFWKRNVDPLKGFRKFNGGLIPQFAKGGIVDESRNNAIGLINPKQEWGKVFWSNLGGAVIGKGPWKKYNPLEIAVGYGKSLIDTASGQNWINASKTPQDQREKAYWGAAIKDLLNWIDIITM